MADPIIYVDRSEVRAGKLDELRQGMEELVQFVEENEPELLAFDVFFDGSGRHMTVIHMHSDPSSLEYHFEVAGRLFPRFADFIQMVSIDVYGRPSAALVERLEQKADMLGSGTVRVHERHAGLERLWTSASRSR